MTHSLLLILTLSLAGVASAANSCLAFDINWNLLAFGFNGKDYNAGTMDTWATGPAKDITTSGRPPFDGPNATCYLSQYADAIYVMGADPSNPSSVYIYDANATSWSAQSVNTNGFNPNSFGAVLDHDTNVFYALSNSELYALDMGLLKAANSTALSWVDVQKPFDTTDYRPVMAIAQNHVYFLDIPGVPAGNAMIFVIHYSYLQPEPQAYGNFPATHGQATSFFQDSGVQQEFAFIPDDGSATYVINVETNTTQTLGGPTIKDPGATYFASTDALVQLSSSGSVSYLPYTPNSATTSASASWSVISKLPSATPSGSVTNSPATASASAAGGAGSSGASSGGGSSGALSVSASASWAIRAAFLFGVLGSLLQI